MDSEYCLFLEKDIEEHFEILQYTNTGITFESIKNDCILPKYISLNTIYKHEYFIKLLKNLLMNIGYKGDFKIVKQVSL